MIQKNPMNRYLAFSAGGFDLCIDMSFLAMIEKKETAVPESPPFPGTFTFNSTQVPVYHLPSLIREKTDPKPDPGQDPKVLVINSGNGTFACCVDGIKGIPEINQARISDMPEIFKGRASQFCPRVLRTGTLILPLMDPGTFEQTALEYLTAASLEGESADPEPPANDPVFAPVPDMDDLPGCTRKDTFPDPGDDIFAPLAKIPDLPGFDPEIPVPDPFGDPFDDPIDVPVDVPEPTDTGPEKPAGSGTLKKSDGAIEMEMLIPDTLEAIIKRIAKKRVRQQLPGLISRLSLAAKTAGVQIDLPERRIK